MGNINFNVIAIAVTIVLVSLIVGGIGYFVNDRNHMAANIETAIGKGMDPMSVRCAYSQTSDTVCIAYAASKR